MTANWPDGLEISTTPTRRVITRGSVRTNGRGFSRKPQSTLVWESGIELAFHKLAQIDIHVTCILAQPVALKMMIGGRRTTRYPDYAIMIAGRAEIHEIKPDRAWLDPKTRSELEAIGTFIDAIPGYSYSVTFESELKREPLHSNVATIWRQLVTPYATTLAHRTREILNRGPVTALDLIERTQSPNPAENPLNGGSWERVLAMIADGHIYYDVETLLTRQSMVWNADSGPIPPRLIPFHKVS